MILQEIEILGKDKILDLLERNHLLMSLKLPNKKIFKCWSVKYGNSEPANKRYKTVSEWYEYYTPELYLWDLEWNHNRFKLTPNK